MSCKCDYCTRAIDRTTDELMTLDEQCQFFKVTRMSINKWSKNPLFPAAHYVGRRPYRWRRDLIAWVNSTHAGGKQPCNARG